MFVKNSKFAWLALILMTADLFLLGEFGIKIVNSFGTQEVGKMADLGNWSVLLTIMRYINIAAMICLLYTIMIKTEAGRYWYLPTLIAGCAGLLAVIVILVLKNQLINAIGVKGMLDMLSIKCKVTDAVWYYAGTSVIEAACGAIPFFRKIIN